VDAGGSRQRCDWTMGVPSTWLLNVRLAIKCRYPPIQSSSTGTVAGRYKSHLQARLSTAQAIRCTRCETKSPWESGGPPPPQCKLAKPTVMDYAVVSSNECSTCAHEDDPGVCDLKQKTQDRKEYKNLLRGPQRSGRGGCSRV
jgi:hypothetical protein